MGKFKVGDRVRVKELEGWSTVRKERGLSGFSQSASGRAGTVRPYNSDAQPVVEFGDGDTDYGHDSELELIEAANPSEEPKDTLQALKDALKAHVTHIYTRNPTSMTGPTSDAEVKTLYLLEALGIRSRVTEDTTYTVTFTESEG